MSQKNYNTSWLDVFVVSVPVVLALATLGRYLCKGEASASTSPPAFTRPVEAIEPPEPARFVLQPAKTSEPFEPEEISEDYGDDKFSPTSARRMRLEEYEFETRRISEQKTIEFFETYRNPPILDPEGLLTQFDVFGLDSQSIYLDKEGYWAWKRDPATFRARAHSYYINPIFLFNEDELALLMKYGKEVARNGKVVELAVPTSHSVVKKAALAALKKRLTAAGVKDAGQLTVQNFKTLRPVNLTISFPDDDNPSTTLKTTVSSSDYDQNGEIKLRLLFKNQEFHQFTAALANGTCRVDYDLYGVIVKTLKTNDDDRNDLKYSAGIVVSEETCSPPRERNREGGLGPMPVAIFGDIKSPSSRVTETEWEERLFRTNGLMGVVKERMEERRTLTFDSIDRISKRLTLRKGSGCLSDTIDFGFNVQIRVKNNGDDAIDISFQMDATFSGADSVYKCAYPETSYRVSRENVAGRTNSPGAVFQFIRFKDFGQGAEATITVRHRESGINHGSANYDMVPHDMGAINLLKRDDCQALGNVFSLLEAKAESHDYHCEGLYPDFGGIKYFHQIFKYSDKCRTKERGTFLTFAPRFQYEVRTQSPTLEIKTNKGAVALIDTNCDGDYEKIQIAVQK